MNTPSSRVPELDALRGLAAIGIVLFHLWLSAAVPLLGTTVDLFFVLSGYLITGIIIKDGEEPHFLRTFYIRRSLRIWPIYYLALLAFVAINPLLPRPYDLAALPYYLTYTQNVHYYWSATAPSFGGPFGHTWTLAVEEQFYLIWPALVLALGRRRVIPLASAAIAVAVLARLGGLNLKLLACRCDGFALGALLAALLADRERVGRHRASYRAGFAVAGAVALAFPAWGWVLFRLLKAALPGADFGLALRTLTALVVNVTYFSVVGLAALYPGHRRLAPLRWRWLCWVGTISYGIYLYHLLVFLALDGLARRLGIAPAPWFDVVKLAGCVGLAALSWYAVEQPILALKRRFEYRGDRAPAASPAAGLAAGMEAG